MTISPTFSSTAPTGWNQLSPADKQKFYDLSSKGDWSAHEAYDHLVPDTLKDNPDEVRAWMDGDPHLGIPDRDCSRIQSGENGGEYTTDNTIMEDASANRSRGADDMTDSEYSEVVSDNQADIDAIEAHYQGDGEIVVADAPTEGPLEVLGDIAEFALPVLMGAKAGISTYKNVQGTENEKLAIATVTAGTVVGITYSLLAVPLIATGVSLFATYRLTGWCINRLTK